MERTKEYITIRGIAKRLGVSVTRINFLVRQGRFPGAEKLGKQWIIPVEAVDNYVPRSPGQPRKPTKRGLVQAPPYSS